MCRMKAIVKSKSQVIHRRRIRIQAPVEQSEFTVPHLLQRPHALMFANGFPRCSSDIFMKEPVSRSLKIFFNFSITIKTTGTSKLKLLQKLSICYAAPQLNRYIKSSISLASSISSIITSLLSLMSLKLRHLN